MLVVVGLAVVDVVEVVDVVFFTHCEFPLPRSLSQLRSAPQHSRSRWPAALQTSPSAAQPSEVVVMSEVEVGAAVDVVVEVDVEVGAAVDVVVEVEVEVGAAVDVVVEEGREVLVEVLVCLRESEKGKTRGI